MRAIPSGPDGSASGGPIGADRFESDALRYQGVLSDLALVSEPDLDRALEAICRVAAVAMPVAHVSVWRYDPERAAIHSSPRWHNGVAGWDAHVVTQTSHPVYWAALHARRVLAVDDAVADPVLAEFRDGYIAPLGIGAMLDSGIRAEQRTLGIVCFEHVGGPRHWTVAEQEFAASVADRVGLAFLLDERRRLEEDLRQTQRMEALGLLAGGIAHDFNNILSVIRATADLARDTAALGDSVQADLDTIARAAERATGLTRKLLVIARREQMARERLDVNEVVGGFVEIAQRIAGGRVEVVAALGVGPIPVDVDRSFLDQALLNLVTNAVHAIDGDGRVALETALERHAAPVAYVGTTIPAGDFARLTVRDSGRGISREELPRIFEPFYSTKGSRGTGLGLAVVYGGVRQHDGHVVVESGVGQGTAVHLWLPAAA